MKKVVLVPDSFKGTLSSIEICSRLQKELTEKYKGIECVSIPIADGGEGTVDAFIYACNGKKVKTTVCNPIGEKIEAYYGIINNDTVIIETAGASGITLLNPLSPLKANTYGTGEQILHGIKNGFQKFVIGLGGSATTDCGTGALCALGAVFYDKKRNKLRPCGESLKDIEDIDLTEFYKNTEGCSFTVLCDVENPLFGENGAAYIFSPQKGANENEVKLLDAGLEHFAKVSKRITGIDNSEIHGTGAAGGFGFAFLTYFKGNLQRGIDAVLDICEFEEKTKNADLIITGEGKMDSQSLKGKVPFGVAQRAGNIPVTAIVGIKQISDTEAENNGISRIIETNAETVELYPTEKEKYIAQFEKAIKRI